MSEKPNRQMNDVLLKGFGKAPAKAEERKQEPEKSAMVYTLRDRPLPRPGPDY